MPWVFASSLASSSEVREGAGIYPPAIRPSSTSLALGPDLADMDADGPGVLVGVYGMLS